eukprot:5543446-Pleurochrysis_carterae.AAC.1
MELTFCPIWDSSIRWARARLAHEVVGQLVVAAFFARAHERVVGDRVLRTAHETSDIGEGDWAERESFAQLLIYTLASDFCEVAHLRL